MKCDKCDNEATVHEMIVKGGVKTERHLCEHCARELGLNPGGATLGQLITKFVVAPQGQPLAPAGKPAAPARPTPPTSCRGCGTTFADFKQTGRLGCSECYATFEPQLGPLLERAHEGATHHVGKSPKRWEERAARADSDAARRERIDDLRRRLEQAVMAEQYEAAVVLRDELRKIEAQGTV
ncbi:MAG: UvrB/UvrC motif-containing protein [Phycisphaerales bacterium]